MANVMTTSAAPTGYNFLESAVVGGPRTGTVDVTAHFLAAIAKLPRGGVVVIPPGKYVVEGLPLRDGLYYVGAGVGETDGSTGTYLALPASPSNHMFVWDGDLTSGFGGGVQGCYMDGGLTTTYDGIHVSTTSQLHRFSVESNVIRGFRRGYSSSGDDRSTQLKFNNFWYCTVGVYMVNNHPMFTGWNDYRDCTYGLQGKLYDARVIDQMFWYCQYGVAPLDASNRPERTLFSGCTFGGTSGYQLALGAHCTATGCLFVCKNEGSVGGIRILGDNVSITGCEFDADGGTYSEGAIVLDTTFFDRTIIAATITGSTFRVEGSTILYHKSEASGRDLSQLVFNNNSIYNSLGVLRRSGNLYGAVLASSISHNVVRMETSTLTTTLTGTITFTNGSATVTGSGSAFLTELRIGDWVRLSTDADTTAGWRRVQAIASDTSLTLTDVYGAAGGAGTGYATQDVIFITTNGGTSGNSIMGNVLIIYSATPSRAAYGVGGQMSYSTVIGNVVRRGLGTVDATSSTGAQIANNAYSP